MKNVNAFAMPAGKVFVTVPLIAMASNEAELAGVVGHEIGHVTARHAAERMYAMEKAQNKTWLYAAGGGVVGAAAGLGLGLILCRDGDTGCLAKAALLGGAVGAGGGLLVQKYHVPCPIPGKTSWKPTGSGSSWRSGPGTIKTR